MKLNPIFAFQTLPSGLAKSATGWQLGTTLIATVINQKTNGETEFKIGNSQFSSHSTRSLSPGAEIAIKLTNLGSPAVVKALNMPREILRSAQQQMVVLHTSKNPQWKSGQLVQAQVRHQNSSGLTVINGNNQVIEGYTTRVLQTDETIAVRVIRDNQLSIINFEAPDSRTAHATSLRQPHFWLNLPLSMQRTMNLGRQIYAKVVKTINSSQTILEVSGKQLSAITSLALPAGQKLLIELVEFSKPIKFSVANPTNTLNMRQELLRNSLPQQASLATLLSNLQFLSQNLYSENNIMTQIRALNPGLAQQLFNIAQKILQQNNSQRLLTDKHQLKAAIIQSGIYLENILKDIGHKKSLEKIVGSELKANLLNNICLILNVICRTNTRKP